MANSLQESVEPSANIDLADPDAIVRRGTGRPSREVANTVKPLRPHLERGVRLRKRSFGPMRGVSCVKGGACGQRATKTFDVCSQPLQGIFNGEKKRQTNARFQRDIGLDLTIARFLIVDRA
ncbi:MAG: hypothetical protein ABW175_20220 [Bradyrhizobium sp.]